MAGSCVGQWRQQVRKLEEIQSFVIFQNHIRAVRRRTFSPAEEVHDDLLWEASQSLAHMAVFGLIMQRSWCQVPKLLSLHIFKSQARTRCEALLPTAFCTFIHAYLVYSVIVCMQTTCTLYLVVYVVSDCSIKYQSLHFSGCSPHHGWQPWSFIDAVLRSVNYWATFSMRCML